MRSWRPFPLGPLPRAHLDILAVYDGGRFVTTRYRVRYPCCGAERDGLPHSSVQARIAQHNERCPACARADNGRQAWLRANAKREGERAAAAFVDSLTPAAPALPPAAGEVPAPGATAPAAAPRAWVALRRLPPGPAAWVLLRPFAPTPRPGALGLVDRLWRRPPSLAGQAPGVWGAQ